MTTQLELSLTGIAVGIWVSAIVCCYAANENSWVSKTLHFPPLLVVSNRFADAQPETFLVFDVLDPRDLARSFWIGTRGLLLLRVSITAYSAGSLTLDGLTADEFGGAYWIAYFTNWSLCLVCTSAGLGVLVSLKYLITSHHTSRTIVRGRPGLTPRHRESQYACGCLAAPASDLEHGIPPDQPQSNVMAASSSSHPQVNTPWVMQPPTPDSSASLSKDTANAETFLHNQLAAPSLSAPMYESAFAQPKRLARTPSDLESMAPAELRYAPQSLQWSILEKLHCLVLQTAAVTATVVLLLYWSVIAEAALYGPYPDKYLRHAVNALITLLDVWFCKAPFASYHLQVMILYGGVYEFCMWLYYDASDHWVYQTTDWRTDKPVLVYILLPVAYVALFFLWFLIATLRNAMGGRCASHLLCPRCYERYSHHAAASFQKQEPPDSATGRLKKQSSSVGVSSSNIALASPDNIDIIAADTRYAGQQILTSVRQSSPSPENPSLMELSRRGSAPRQGTA